MIRRFLSRLFGRRRPPLPARVTVNKFHPDRLAIHMDAVTPRRTIG